ncbi:MAG: hypothetical protein SF029_23490 [bacterium]|nr:hypothetical protein [bacterium]
MKVISSEAHGALDYLTAGTLLALPRLLRLSPKVTTLLTGAAIGTFVYSLFTRYDLGLIKLVPFKTHLLFDLGSGLAFMGAPLLLRDEDETVNAMIMGIGAFEVAASILTDGDDT